LSKEKFRRLNDTAASLSLLNETTALQKNNQHKLHYILCKQIKYFKSMAKANCNTLKLEFLKISGGMSNSCVVSDFIKNDLDLYNQYFMQVMKCITNDNTNASFRVWLNHELNEEYYTKVKQNIVLDSENISEWSKRVFESQKFGIIINNVQRYCDELNAHVLEVLKPIIDSTNIPAGGFEMTLFIGNYGFTPLGIHRDFLGGKVIHFHLGPGIKKMYQWSDDVYQRLVGGPIVYHNPEKIIDYASKYEFGPGDLFFMSEDSWHIGQSDELSVGLAFWFNNHNRGKLFADLCMQISGMPILDKDDIMLPILNFNSEFTSKKIPFHFDIDESYKSLSIEQFFLVLHEDNQLKLLSNGGFSNNPLKLEMNEIISFNGFVKGIKPYQIFIRKINEDAMFFYVRGHQLWFPYDQSLPKIIEKLNSESTLSIEDLFFPLLKVWEEEIILYFIKLLYVHKGIEYINIK
jgi:hypothetical protein